MKVSLRTPLDLLLYPRPQWLQHGFLLLDPNISLLDSAYSQVIAHVTQAPDLPPNDRVCYSEICEHEDKTVGQNSIGYLTLSLSLVICM